MFGERVAILIDRRTLSYPDNRVSGNVEVKNVAAASEALSVDVESHTKPRPRKVRAFDASLVKRDAAGEDGAAVVGDDSSSARTYSHRSPECQCSSAAVSSSSCFSRLRSNTDRNDTLQRGLVQEVMYCALLIMP